MISVKAMKVGLLAFGVAVGIGGVGGQDALAAGVVYVNNSNSSGVETGVSWAAAFRTLQPALDAAAAQGAEVWVAEGNYNEWRANEGILWMREAVAMYGGFAGTETARSQRDWMNHPTVINGRHANAGTAASTVMAGADNAILDGFIIRGGRGGEGAGLANRGASPAVSNCVFWDNRSDSYGGAVFNGEGAAPTFAGCWFIDNYARTAGGAIVSIGAGVSADDCRFKNNGAGKFGGALYSGAGGVTSLVNCRLHNNEAAQQGGAVFADAAAEINIDFARFFSNRAGARGGAVFANDGAQLTTRGTLYAMNEARSQGGAIAVKNAAPTLAGCTFADNLAGYRGGALYNYENAQPLVADCIMWNNLPDSVGNIDTSGILAYYSNIQFYPVQGDNFAEDPLFADPDIGNYRLLPGSPCIDAGLSTNPVAYGGVHLDFDWQERGYDGDGRGRVTGDGSDYDVGCDEFTGLANVGVEEPPDNPFWENAGEGEGVIEEGEGVPQEGEGEPASQVVYVNKSNPSGVESGLSWQQAFVELQAAIDYAQLAGLAEVWVAKGTYDETRGNDGTLLLRDGINLYGGFAGLETSRTQRDPAVHITVIDGAKAAGGAAAAHVVTGANAVLDGFTITGGAGLSGAGMFNYQVSPSVLNCTFSGNAATETGGAMFNFGGAAPFVQHCLFQNNSATNNGGAVFNIDAGPVFSDCTFANNTAEAGAAAMNINATPVFAACLFTDNAAALSGGGISNLLADAELRQCRFVSNQAAQFGGAILNNQSSPRLDGCHFYANRSLGVGGGMMNVGPLGASDSRKTAPIVTNCVFAENRAAQTGGAIMSNDGDPILVNCTIYGNLADISGGGIANLASRLTMANSILWDNQGEEILLSESTAAITYSCIQGNYPGTGNFQAAPQWINPALRDFHLRADSPCVDAGLDAASAEYGLVSHDFDGDTRPFGPQFDIGADEYTGGITEGEGGDEGEGQPEGAPEGMPDGEGALEGEGGPEGEGEGPAEGEGQPEGEGEGVPPCALDEAGITFPLDGAMLLVPQNSESAGLAVSAQINCYEDVRSVEMNLNQDALTGIAVNPYTAVAGDITQLPAGVHTLSMTAYGRGYGRTIVDAASEFIFNRAPDSVDADANGLPDNPFQVLPVERDTWLSCVTEPASGAKRLAQVIRWQRSGLSSPPPVQAVLASPYDNSQRVIISAPENLLESGEIGLLAVCAAPDLFTLMGPVEGPLLGGTPSGELVFGAQCLHIAALASTDNGINYQPIDPARIAAAPIGVIFQGVRPPVTLGAALYLHPAAVAADPVAGMQLRAAPGTWTTANTLQVAIETNRISASLAEVGVLAPYAVPNNQGIIGVSPSRLSAGAVAVTRTATASFTVVNLGTGLLQGTASVAAPFSIASGANYALEPGESQKVVVLFAPPDIGDYSAIVAFTGGGGANRTIAGKGKSLPKLFYFIGCSPAEQASPAGRGGDLAVIFATAVWLVFAGRRAWRQAPK